MKSFIPFLFPLIAGPSFAADFPLETIKLPPGFKISVYATVPGARSLALGDDGTLYVGSGGASGKVDKVYAVRDLDKNGTGENVTVLADELNSPNGVAFRQGDLYVAEINRILVFKGIGKRIGKDAKFEVMKTTFPDETHHGWKFIRFAPDGSLFVPVGAPCNLCLREPTHAALFKISPDGKTKTLVAQGIRNTVGFDFHPETGDLYFSENGRDLLGDDTPPDELNVLPRKLWENPPSPVAHFGYPFCHGKGIKDPEFGEKRGCPEFREPVLTLGPHVAALGLRFYTGKMFPPEYRNQIFLAEHGSWNRTSPLGYRVQFIRRNSGGAWEYQTFASGWLNSDGSKWGRPVDVEMAPDGSLFLSDDHAGAIYKITYAKP